MVTPVRTVYLWMNGNVMAFDADGQQVAEYQGSWREALPKLVREQPTAAYHVGVWEQANMPVPFPQLTAFVEMLEGKW